MLSHDFWINNTLFLDLNWHSSFLRRHAWVPRSWALSRQPLHSLYTYRTEDDRKSSSLLFHACIYMHLFIFYFGVSILALASNTYIRPWNSLSMALMKVGQSKALNKNTKIVSMLNTLKIFWLVWFNSIKWGSAGLCVKTW